MGISLLKWERQIAAVLLLCFVLQSLYAASQLSITYDEKRHLPNGYLTLRTGTALNIATPILAPAWAALPLLFLDTHLPDASKGQISFTDAFFSENPLSSTLFWARLMMIVLGVALGLLIFHWGKQLFGVPAGLFSLFIYSFSPTVLGYGPLVVIDLPLALAITGVLYASWKLCSKPSWNWLILTGVLFGIAQAVKYPAVLLVPVLAFIWIALYFRSKISFKFLAKQRWVQFILSLLLIFAIGWVTLNSCYGFKGTFTPFAQSLAHDPYLDVKYSYDKGVQMLFPNLSPQKGEALNFIAAHLPTMLPYHYALNFLYQVKVSKDDLTNFLDGQIYNGGKWDYYLRVFLIKEPIALLILIALAIVTIKYAKPIGTAKWSLFVPLAFFMLYMSLSTRQVALRYILMIYPFLFIALGNLTTVKLSQMRKPLMALLGVCMAWYVAAAVSAAPNYLGYANEFVGQQAYEHVVEGNIDMGQGLIQLKQYMAVHQIPKVALSYFGDIDPAVYGISYENYCPYNRLKDKPYRTEPANGTYAVSVTALQLKERDCLGWLHRYQPAALVGGSILIYTVTDIPTTT